ncbi:hypothetical protein [Pseudomonas sp. PS02290]|uniref:hypothetical protein n=1 Tax=Pseudomonas sp. PS02290 TaxID=2991430 RepID=UPI00249A7F9C|nr:hypothetical protein [Pseudomonas sp. PS02290]
MNTQFALPFGLEDTQSPILPTPDTLPPRSSADAQRDADLLQPVQNWSHPFRDKRDSLQHLTHLANAASGSYPLGSSGLWHGGVHFDAGTAGTLDQSSVHCIADGEVVAYRIDEQSPDTTYFVNKQLVLKPFSRNFVLVRHRLQPPAIKGSTDTPPSLIIYSLYMHLRDWAAYEKDSAVVRPGLWKSGSTLQVRVDVNDIHGDYPGQRGLNVRNKASKGAIIGWLPRGAEVQVSGEGTYRKLENTPGPDHLKDASGALRGYVCADFLRPLAGEQHRVVSETPLNVRAHPMVRKGNEIGTLYPGTEVTVSGTGRFRKLEQVNQYVHFASLQSGAVEPEARGSVVVLDKPVAIKAGELIGHMGRYHEGAVDYPENRLHLEVFSAGDVKTFLRLSRLWADKLPASSRTWLKLAKGNPVVAHQGTFSSKKPPTLKAASTFSAAQLLLPKSLIDGLPVERKIAVPASADSKACNWYRLDGLLHDADNNLLDGWVREEVGVTPWLSPWSWEGYETLADYDSPRSMLASFMRASGRFNEDEITRHGAAADKADQGPIKKRLFDIIDRNRDGKLSGSEIQAALRLPAHAQSISQLIVRYQSEWHHVPGKWDALDDLLGHGGSTPNRNWLAEKQRIRELTWWAEVAGQLGLPADGKLHHLHPIGLIGCFEKTGGLIDVEAFLTLYAAEHTRFAPGTPALTAGSRENLRRTVLAINKYYEDSTDVASVYEVAYMLATVRHETYYYPTSEFFSEKPEYGKLSYFDQYDPVLAPEPRQRKKAVLYGNVEKGDGFKYRGRGCVHLTWKVNYQKFSDLTGFDYVADPDAAAKVEHSVPIMIMGMAKGLFTGKKLSSFFAGERHDYLSARQIINGNDAATLIASYAERFEKMLTQSSKLQG